MKSTTVAVLGGTGRTGTHLVDTLLAHGYPLRLLVRDPSKLPRDMLDNPFVTVVEGSLPEGAPLRELVRGADVVMSALGPDMGKGKDRSPNLKLHTETATKLLQLMREEGIDRFIGLSGAGVDAPGDRKSLPNRVVSALMQRLGGPMVLDKMHEMDLWWDSGMNFTLVRPPRLVDGPGTGDIEHHGVTSPKKTSITREDLAKFMFKVLEEDLYHRQAPLVANGKTVKDVEKERKKAAKEREKEAKKRKAKES